MYFFLMCKYYKTPTGCEIRCLRHHYEKKPIFHPWREEWQVTKVELMGQSWGSSVETEGGQQQAGADIDTIFDETTLTVRSKMWFLPKIFVLPLNSAFLLTMITPVSVHSLVLGAPFQQEGAARPAAVGVVELARARWHTGYVGKSPPRASTSRRARRNEIISLQAAFCVIKKKKKINRCSHWRQHQCFAF